MGAMPMALILSSHVAASRVGGMAQVLALEPFKIDAMLVPTVLFGRHPGWGPPGGAPVAAAVMTGMLDGIEANGLFALTDAVITGYFSTPDQVEVAADALTRVRAANPDAVLLVDPVIGDEGKGLYVKPEVAVAVRDQLVPHADYITPNRFELGWLVGLDAPDGIEQTIAMVRSLGQNALVSSVPAETDGVTGALYCDGDVAVHFAHLRLPNVPNGTGDVLTALFAAALVQGDPPREAAARAVDGIIALIDAGHRWGSPELPVVAAAEQLLRPSTDIRIRAL